MLQTAARVSDTFHQDVLRMLEDPDAFRWAVRVAAHNVVIREKNEQQDKANKGGPRVAGKRGR